MQNKGKFRALAIARATNQLVENNEMKAEFRETRIRRFRKWNIGWRR